MRLVAPTTLDLPSHPSRLSLSLSLSLSPRSPPPNSAAWNFAVPCAPACPMGREMSVGERSRVRGVSSSIRIVPVGAAIWRDGYWREVRRSLVFTEKEATQGCLTNATDVSCRASPTSREGSTYEGFSFDVTAIGYVYPGER
ncbi:hypothetical protein ALC56_08322 [Trachymyrmex septentrionalis]|uniref:Uncharacterized protein n=1 Tax=Trachymyrmex septentrionalis TaxID=34720 RepID=A0A195F9I3_9HYME|nr:hypothetical protein ALC56_08322 [Trachymyrmex septentrionalis]